MPDKRKIFKVIVLLFALSARLGAQAAIENAIPPPEDSEDALSASQQDPQIVNSRYQIFSDYSEGETLLLALTLEELFNFYNRYFNFNPQDLNGKLRVRYFSSKERFDRYLRRVVGRSYDHFVYIDYNDLALNELVIYPANRNFQRLLVHFSFLQFIESFVQEPPIWLREGFAIYFESTSYNPADQMVQFQENNDLLNNLQNMVKNNELIVWEEFISYRAVDITPFNRQFYPQAWGLVSFLVDHRERDTEQLLQKVIGALDSDANEEQNIANLQEVLLSILPATRLQRLFERYINERPSFRNMIEEGINRYNNQRLGEAETIFYQALAFDRESHVPYYYLGLVNYEKGEYKTAEHFYLQALMRSDVERAGIIYYALGLNALASNVPGKARNYFLQAQAQAPELQSEISEALKRTELPPTPATPDLPSIP